MRGDSRSHDFERAPYDSVSTRIAWTNVRKFPKPIDKIVLEALATFANFRTGIRANPRLELLVERSGIPRMSLVRSLRRLEADAWIVAQRRHRCATSYDIVLDRL